METINLIKYNRHWEKQFHYSFSKKRAIFDLLLRHLKRKEIVEITGLRRSGKTTLLLQLIEQLITDKEVDPFCVWYFTFDEERLKLDDLLQNFSQQTQIDFKKEKIYIFLDEVQKLADFQNQLKVYYDLYPNLKFFISGSTSLFIKKKTQESLAGRIINFLLLPLNFQEYLYFKDRSEIMEKPLIFRKDIEKEFEIFLESQFIESIFIKNKDERREYLISIIKKIIFEDIPQTFSVDNPEILWMIVKIIAQNPGMLVDYQSLSKEIGISNKTLSNYLFYLEESFLLRKIYNFSRNLITSEKKLKKFYLTSPSFSWALTDFAEKGRLAENLVISLKDYRFFWRDVYKHEVDFVEVNNEAIVPIEVKYRNEVLANELKNLSFFAKRFSVKKGLVLTKTFTEQRREVNGIEIAEKGIWAI